MSQPFAKLSWSLGLLVGIALSGCAAQQAASRAPAEPAAVAPGLVCLADYLSERNLRGRVVQDEVEGQQYGARASVVWSAQEEGEPVLVVQLDPGYGLFNIVPWRDEAPLERAARAFAGVGAVTLGGAQGCGLLKQGAVRLQFTFVLRDERGGFPQDTLQRVQCRIPVATAQAYLARQLTASELLRQTRVQVELASSAR